ncbi:MAG: aminotransferase class I/II-fold pyridoxal phosphate-dependent enzyme [Ilumatobacteraceae bacterium]
MTGSPRPAIAALPGYRPGKSAQAAAAEHGIADVIKLASNELPYGPLPSVVEAIRGAAEGVHLYPDHRATELRAAIAASVGVGADHVTVGAGSVGIIQQLALSYVDRGEGIAFGWPSFEAYPVFAALVEATQLRPPLRRQTFDLEALADAITADTIAPDTIAPDTAVADGLTPSIKLVFIANPNNPTGTVVGTDELVAFLERVPPTCLVVIDEAYREFVTDARIDDSMPLVERFPNVVVLRTFSKAHALAAVRVGYAIAQPPVIDVIDRTLVPFVVNGLGQTAALASIAAVDEMRARVDTVVSERSRVAAALRASGWMIPEPQGNFVWLPAGDASLELGVAMERFGIVTRAFDGVGIRATIGDPTANDRFLDVFTKSVIDVGPAAWQLPTGELAVRVAAELDRLDTVVDRLRGHAAAGPVEGLTAADEPTGEQWDSGQVWAHLAEFGAYWRSELRSIVDAASADPVPFGRTKRDPRRISEIEANRRRPIGEQMASIERDIAAFRADLAEMTTDDWSRIGRHETLGDLDVWQFLAHFVTGHYEEHADQLEEL